MITINTIDSIKTQNDLVHLAENAGAHFTHSGKVLRSACPIHGGDNPQAFTVYTGKDGNQHFKCFTRAECNLYGSDVIAFYRALNKVDFQIAVEALGGEINTLHRSRLLPKVVIHKSPNDLPDKNWQACAWQVVETSSDWLHYERGGQPGRDFLSRRGIERGMAYAYQLGFGYFLTRKGTPLPAIVIPWWDAKNGHEFITAVTYRLIQPIVIHNQNGKDRVTKMLCLPGSKRILFGLHFTCPTLHNTLVLVEGELNAVSIAQADLPGVSVVSFGSESGGHPGVLHYVAREYQNVVVWADKPERGQNISQSIGRDVVVLSSPYDPYGVKLDANEMLQRGTLADYLAKTLDLPPAAR